MALVKRTELFPEWNKFFGDFFGSDLLDWSHRNYSTTNTTLPTVNIKETNESFEVEMAAPGMNKSDFKVELNNNLLSISSEKTNDQSKNSDDRYSHHEFSYQSFSRTFTLPNISDQSKIEASYENGILKVLIPKREEAKPKPSRMIEIK